MSCAQNRIERIRALMAELSLDAFLLRNLSSIKWATAFDGVFDNEDAHALLITHNQAILHTDSRYATAATDAATGGPVSIDAERKTHAEFVREALTVFEASSYSDNLGVFKANSESSVRRLVFGVESSMMLSEFRGLEKVFANCDGSIDIRETQNAVPALRSIKDAQEIERLRFAQSITDKAFSHIIDFVCPGMTEREVQRELEDFMIRNGASMAAFPSIVATGENGANPHAIPGNTLLEAGQALVLDFGAQVLNYCSDMTRMVFLGQPNEVMMRAYTALREANESVSALLKPGITGTEAQEHAESILAEYGFAHTMGHSLGHGVGIDIHESPTLSSRNAVPLEPGNVVTVEPGIYIPHSFGMRLEDFGVVTQTGFEVFTQSSHDMVII